MNTDKPNACGADASIVVDPNEADDNYSLTFELETSREEILDQLLQLSRV